LWVRAGERAWTLEQSENRRRLVARLQNQDFELFQQHLQDRIQWARQGGPRDVVDPSLRRAQLEPFAIATLLDSIGDAGRGKLLAGAPFVTQVGKLPTAAHDLLLQYLTFRNGGARGKAPPAEELDRWWYALILARTPTDPKGTHLIESMILPNGVRSSRATLFGMLGRQAPPLLISPFGLWPAQEADERGGARRVTLTLAPAPGSEPGETVAQNLDQVLETVARECALNVIADGYLRAPARFAANLK